MELPTDTGRVDGPHHAIYCREGSQLAAGEELCRQNLFHQEITFPKTMRNGLFKRDCTGGSCCLSFIGQPPININAGNGDDLWIRQTIIPRSKPIRSTQQPTTHSTESQLRIQLKARNKSVRQQARLVKSQNTSLSLQSRPFGGCELLQNVYLCISTYNLKVIFTCITASNKTFVQKKMQNKRVLSQ